MTIEEMHASILLKVDRVGSYSTANLIPGEIDDFINDAVDEFIDEQRQIIRQYRYTERGMEAQENLRTIITRSSTSNNITSTTILGDSAWEVPLSEFSGFDYFVGGTADFSGEVNILRHVSSSFLTDKERGAHMNFFERGIPISVEADKIIGFLPRDRSAIPDEVTVLYLNYPDPVKLDPNNSSNSVDLNLPDHTHRDIISIASAKIIQSLSGQQANQQE